MDAIKMIQDYGVVPVLGLKDPETAPKVAAALKKGGLPLVEVTMRAERAMDCLQAIKQADMDMMVGAGTILHQEQVNQAKEAGADFIVTPGLNPKVVSRALELDMPVVPGCVTPGEIEAGLELGLAVFKFFPSEPMGGMNTIQQLCGPYRSIKFIPTAGITMSNMVQYLTSDKIAAVGGSFMAPASMIQAQDWDGITALCRRAVDQSLGFSLAHIGINGKNKQEGMAIAQWFFERFGFSIQEGTKSNFAASYVECCNQTFPGKYGHIGIATNSPRRAVAYFQAKGIPLREEFKNINSEGELIAVYLEEEIGGFAVHIVKKS